LPYKVIKLVGLLIVYYIVILEMNLKTKIPNDGKY